MKKTPVANCGNESITWEERVANQTESGRGRQREWTGKWRELALLSGRGVFFSSFFVGIVYKERERESNTYFVGKARERRKIGFKVKVPGFEVGVVYIYDNNNNNNNIESEREYTYARIYYTYIEWVRTPWSTFRVCVATLDAIAKVLLGHGRPREL